MFLLLNNNFYPNNNKILYLIYWEVNILSADGHGVEYKLAQCEKVKVYWITVL